MVWVRWVEWRWSEDGEVSDLMIEVSGGVFTLFGRYLTIQYLHKFMASIDQ